MSSTAKDQVGRMLALVPLIRRRGEMHVEEAAALFGVTPAELVRDLNTLVFCGLPGQMPGDLIEMDFDALEPGGDGMIRIWNADYLSAPLRLSAAEASALVVALRTLRDSATEDTLGTIDSALAKLEAAAEGAPAVASVHVPERERAVTAVKSTLAEALRTGRQVRLGYHVPARDEDTERVVDPIGVVTLHGLGYLDAWCHRAEDRRSFRLDRVVRAEVLETPAEPHDLAPLDLADGIFRPAPDLPVARLRLAPRARWVAEYYPVEAVSEGPDGALDVEMRVADPAWMTRLLLRLSGGVEVLGPDEFIQTYRQAARSALALYT